VVFSFITSQISFNITLAASSSFFHLIGLHIVSSVIHLVSTVTKNLSKMRAQKIFEVTTIFQVLLASTTFLIPVSAKPQRSFGHGLTRRADKPGIGVEVEFGNVVIKAPKDLTDDQLEAIKGKDLVPVGFDGGSKTNWKLTVEIASGSKPKKLMPEAIVDGIQNKVGARQTKQIGGEIFNFLVRRLLPF
jgi:hypothetical protein